MLGLLDVFDGFQCGVRALLRKELHTRSRGWRPAWLLGAYLGLLTLAVSGFVALVETSSGTIPPTIGTMLFAGLAFGAVLLLAFITPALTVGAISGERERQTLDLLLVARASALGLAGGKLLASLVYTIYLLAASLPVFALVYLFGGVPLPYLAIVLAIAAFTALAHAALGLLVSTVLQRTVLATVVSYLIVLGLTLGMPVLWTLSGQVVQLGALVSASETSPRVLLPPGAAFYASPLLALLSLLVGLLASAGSVSAGLMPTPGLPITQQAYLASPDPLRVPGETVVAWAPWVYYLVFASLFTLGALLLSAAALAPVQALASAPLPVGSR